MQWELCTGKPCLFDIADLDYDWETSLYWKVSAGILVDALAPLETLFQH